MKDEQSVNLPDGRTVGPYDRQTAQDIAAYSGGELETMPTGKPWRGLLAHAVSGSLRKGATPKEIRDHVERIIQKNAAEDGE